MVIKSCLNVLASLYISFIILAYIVSSAEAENNENLDTWEAPATLRKFFPYYLSGLDHEGQPVWVFEFGKWNFRKYFEEGGDAKVFDTYVKQMFYRMSKGERFLPANKTDGDGTGFYTMIADLDGYDATQLAHRRSLQFTLNMARIYMTTAAISLDQGYAINLNYVAESLVNNLIAPILGQVFSKIETGGTNKAKWIPLLLKKIPKESLPPWYGGSAEFKPVSVYG